jgi:hypothetical protein
MIPARERVLRLYLQLADAQASEAVQPRNGAFDGPADGARAGAVWLAAFGDRRANASLAQKSAVLVVVVAAVREERFGPSTGSPDGPGHGRDLVEQGQQLGGAYRPAVRGRPGWDRFWAPACGPDVGRVDHRPRPVELVLRPQLLQQERVQLVPDAGLVPGRQQVTPEPINDHSSSETIHGRDCLFPTTTPTIQPADSHMINSFC